MRGQTKTHRTKFPAAPIVRFPSDQAFRTFQGVFSLNDGVQWRWLDSLRQEVADASESQQFDAQGDFMQRSSEDLWSHVSLQPAQPHRDRC